MVLLLAPMIAVSSGAASCQSGGAGSAGDAGSVQGTDSGPARVDASLAEGGHEGGTTAPAGGGDAAESGEEGPSAAIDGAQGSNGADASLASPDGGGVASPAPTTAVYDGLRGQDFDHGWKFMLGDVSNAQSASFDDSSWRSLDLPHDWSIELPFNASSPSGAGGGYLDGGVGWYRKTFSVDAASAGQRVFVEFDGVYMNSQVWINGTSLGTRPYGYSSFEYDLTPYLHFGGDNVIAVRVNNNQPNSRWYSGSGIYRNVWLTTLNPVHVPYDGVFVSTSALSDASATLAIATEVLNQSAATAAVTVTTTVLDPLGAVVTSVTSPATNVAAGATVVVSQTATVPAPQLWSVSAPNLYRVQVDLKAAGPTLDTYVTPFGIRATKFDPNTGFSLNGQNMKIRGVALHHDLGALGSAVSYRAIEREVQILKSMGANAIRTAHNPPAPELLDVADRLGVLILDEAFDTWEQTKTANDYGLYFKDWAQQDLQDMVRRDRNHPSVIAWSIGNEVAGSTTAVAQNLKSWVLAMDGTRLVTWASNKMGGPHVSEGDDRDVAALLDIAGYNYAPYAGDYDADHAAHPGWVLLGTETTAAVRTRGVYHTPADTVTLATSQSSPDRQCSSYDNEATTFGATAESAYSYDNARPFVAGMFVWSGFDYIGEPTPYSAFPSKSSYFGIMDTAGFPKDIYYFYKSRWTTDPVVHILPHWNWTTGTDVTVFVYNNCDSVELFLNDASLGSKALASGGALHLEWDVPWASGTLRATCTRGGQVVATDQVRTAGAAASASLSADRTTLRADGKDLVYVTVDVLDANGVLVPNAANSVSFAVSGPGRLVGVDNGNPLDTASYKGTSRKAFNGKALAIVQSTGAAGPIVVQASSAGLTGSSVTVMAGN